MGIEKLAEELGGAFVAEKALGAVDPNAGFLEKAAAGIAGFEGGGALGDMVGGLLNRDGQSQPNSADENIADENADNQNT